MARLQRGQFPCQVAGCRWNCPAKNRGKLAEGEKVAVVVGDGRVKKDGVAGRRERRNEGERRKQDSSECALVRGSGIRWRWWWWYP